MRNSGDESGCARKCVEANDSGGFGIDRNSEDTTQGDRPAAVVKVPSPEYQSPLMRAAEKAGKVVAGWSESKRRYAERAIRHPVSSQPERGNE